MTVLTIPYRVSAGGFVDHWLWAGPHATLLESRPWKPDHIKDLNRPIEWDPPLKVGEKSYPWEYLSCAADHILHFSDTPVQPETRYYFAYVEVRQDRRGDLAVEVEATGQVQMWINQNQWTAGTEKLLNGVVRHSFAGPVPKGRLGLFLVLSQYFAGNTACHLRLKLKGEGNAGRLLTLPTSVNPDRRLALEEFIEACYISKRVCGPLDPVVLRWDESLKGQTFLGLNLSKYQGPSYMEVMHTQVNSEATYEMATAPVAAPGHYRVMVRPGMEEYYELNQRITRVLDVYLIKSHFEQTPEQDVKGRKLLMLRQAGEFGTPLLRALAKATLERQSGLDPNWDDLLEDYPIAKTNLLALLAALVVVLKSEEKPTNRTLPESLATVLHRAMERLQVGGSESGTKQAFLFSICRLARQGLLQSEQEFPPIKASTSEHEVEEIHLAMRDWMSRGLGGWDSHSGLAHLITACLLLANCKIPTILQDLSFLLLDKAMFILVLNSWRGIYAAAGPETDTLSLLDARLDPLAAVSYHGWGLGLPDSCHAVGLALANSKYEVPAVIQELGLFVPEELHSEERQVWVRDELDKATEPSLEFHRWTYKTPDFVLSSLQDFRPGQIGCKETPWLATLGYAARVHVSQPEYVTENEAVPRNYWRGNATIPRVAQWKETVVSLYAPGPRIGLGFTHAHFPQQEFDDFSITDNWAFARKGEGYLAIFAANGLQAATSGLGAYRSLRSPGQENVWVCCLGRQAWDSEFTNFRTRVQESIQVASGRAYIKSRQGQEWTYGLDGPLTMAGEEVPQRSNMHFNSPLCQAPFPASTFLIKGISGTGLELHFE